MKYNFDRIQDAYYCCEACFLENALNEYNNLDADYKAIVIVARDYLAHDLFRTLSEVRCECGDRMFDFGFVEFNNFEYGGEYIITIAHDGAISLEQMITDEGIYLLTEGEIVFIHEDCNYKAIDRLNNGDNNIVIFGFDEGCE